MKLPDLPPFLTSWIPQPLSNCRNSKFINDRLKRLFKQEEPDHVRLRMLFYASLLMAFFKNHRMASKSAALKSALGPVPGPLFQGLLTRYTEDQLTSSKEDAKKRYSPSFNVTNSDLSVRVNVRIKLCAISSFCVSCSMSSQSTSICLLMIFKSDQTSSTS